MKKEIKKIKLVLISVFLFSGLAKSVRAAELEISWPTSPTGRELASGTSIAELTRYFYEWGITIGIIIFFGSLVFSGFQYLTSTGKPKKVTAARKRLIASFSGIILLLGSYLILNIINPELTEIRDTHLNLGYLTHQRFSRAPKHEEDLCEFALLHVTEEDREEETFLTVPGVAHFFEEAAIFPETSHACTPEKKEEFILEVREEVEMEEVMVETGNGQEIEQKEEVYLALYNRKGERVEGVDRVQQEDADIDEIRDLYAERYEKIDMTLTIDENNQAIRDGWLTQSERGLYNSIHITEEDENICEFVITQSDFQNPRCLEVEIMDQNSIEITEWRRKGFPSLIHTLTYLQRNDTLFEQPPGRECPTAEEIYDGNPAEDELGYRRDRTGGGCNHTFYKGDKFTWFRGWFFEFETAQPACINQISRSSANMNSYRGMVDDQTTCLEHIRDEEPIEVKELTFDLWLVNATNRYDCDDAHKDACGNIDSSSLQTQGEEVGALRKASVTRRFQIPAYQSVTVIGKAKEESSSNSSFYQIHMFAEGKDSGFCEEKDRGEEGDELRVECNFNMTSQSIVIKLEDNIEAKRFEGRYGP